MILDTKFRRETSNFKIKYTDGVYIPDPNSENPTEPIQGLLQILPKNLGPEDFMGMIATKERTFAPGVSIDYWTIILTAQDMTKADYPITAIMLYAPGFTITGQNESWDFGAGIGTKFVYIPESGYLVDDKYGDPD